MRYLELAINNYGPVCALILATAIGIVWIINAIRAKE